MASRKRKVAPEGGENAGPGRQPMRYEELRSDGQRWKLADAEDVAPNLVPAVHKAVQIIAYINAQNRAVPLSAIAEATGVTKSHCFSILRTLVHHGWLHINPETKSYELGAGLLRDASAILRRATSLLPITTVVRDLPLRTGTSCILSEPHEDGGFVVVEKANAPGKLEISYPVGHFFPRDASAQMQALLAWAPPETAQRWLAGWSPTAYTPKTATSLEDVLAQFELTRRRGYARSVDEFTVGIGALALPIFDTAGRVIFILDCVGLTPEIREREREIAAELQSAVSEIHAAIGGRAPADFPTPLERAVSA